MKPKISTLAIERFRTFRQLTLNDLGRVNLITGRNNTGKSSILEALHILASDASPYVIFRILHNREEDLDEPRKMNRSYEEDSFPMITNLFQGFPLLDKINKHIEISANGSGISQRLSLSIGNVVEQVESDGTRRFVERRAEDSMESESQLALIIRTNIRQRIIPLERFGRAARQYNSERARELPFPCIFIGSYGSERTNSLGLLWDKTALSDLEKEVVEALRIISPEIVAVSMIGGEDSRRSRTAIVRSSNIPYPVPLRSFGDGLNRLFGIVLSLVNAKDGLLLIDEVENGLHHSVQLEIWRAIFRLSRHLDIQVFATSHSWDSIESFQKAASEDPEEGVLIRLARKGENIIPTLFREDELAVATRDRIEVR